VSSERIGGCDERVPEAWHQRVARALARVLGSRVRQGSVSVPWICEWAWRAPEEMERQPRAVDPGLWAQAEFLIMQSELRYRPLPFSHVPTLRRGLRDWREYDDSGRDRPLTNDRLMVSAPPVTWR